MKRNIYIKPTEWLQNKIKCPYLYQPAEQQRTYQQTYYNISEPMEAGKYFHVLVENMLGSPAQIINNQDNAVSIHKAAKKAAQTIRENISLNSPVFETRIDYTMSSENYNITLVAQPDIFEIIDDELILVELKYSDTLEDIHSEQAIIYSGILCFLNSEIKTVEINIVNKTGIYTLTYGRNALMFHFNSIMNRIKKWSENTPATYCDECATCKNKLCVKKINTASSIISIISQKAENEGREMTETELLDIFSLVYSLNISDNIREQITETMTETRLKQGQALIDAVIANGDEDLIEYKPAVNGEKLRAKYGNSIPSEYTTEIRKKINKVSQEHFRDIDTLIEKYDK